MDIRRYALLTTALAGLTAASAAHAEDGPADKTADKTVSEVVVTGIRESLKQSLEVKRAANAVVEVVTAEAVGKFPDTNIAESLAHLPGVSVDRQFGEGDRVSIDGTDPALNRIFIDGHSVASAAWGGDPQDRSSRNFNYSLLSPDIIGRLELYKSPEARLDEGSLGATLIVNTRKPLDLKPVQMFASGGYSYNDRSEKGNGKLSGLLSWHNDSETFGVLGAVTYDKENLTRSGIEYFGYGSGGDFVNTDASGNLTPKTPGMTINGAAPTQASLAALQAARYPAFINYDYFQQVRQRLGFNTAVQWRPAPNLEFTLSTLNIRGKYDNISQAAFSYNVRTDRATAVNVANNLVTQATYGPTPAGTASWNGELDENFRRTNVDNDTYDLAYRWDVGGFKISGDLGWTKATGGTNPEYLLNWRTTSGFTYGFNGKETSLNYVQDPKTPAFWQTEYLEAVNDPAGHQQTVPGYNNGQPFTGFQVGGIGRSKITDTETYAKVDFEHDLDFWVFDKLRFGAKGSRHENLNTTFGAATYADVANGNFNIGAYSSDLSPSGLFDGLDATGNATQFGVLTKGQVKKAILALPTRFNPLDTGSYSQVIEKIGGAYVQGDFRGERFRGNIGLRLATTEDDSRFFQTSGAVTQLVDVNHKYTKLLPSFNIAYDAGEDVVLRFAAAKVIARPRYTDMAGAFTIATNGSGLIGTAGGGNPDLKPYEATNYEATVEWYFKPNSLLAGEVFYRDISNYVLNVTQTDPLTLTDSITGVTGQYFVTGPVNAGKATVEGFSISGQWDIGWGFGVQANYTFSDAQTTSGLNLPFLSRHTANLIPYYENGPWSARVSLNYRSEYFTGIGRLNSQDSTDQYRQVDAQVAYHVNPRTTVTFNALNLLDETYYSYSSTKSAPTGIYRNGRVLSMNVSYRM